MAHGNGALLDLLHPDREDVGHLAKRMLAHLVVDLLVAGIAFGADAGLDQLRGDLLDVIVRVRDDRGDDDLARRQPQRQLACVAFDQDADEALERAEAGAMQHDRAVLRAVDADIARVQPLGQVRVDLQRAALPVAADRIGQHEFELRPVEGAFAFLDLEVIAGRLAGIAERGFRMVPAFLGADALLRPGRQLDAPVGEAEVGIDLGEEVDELLRLDLDLVFHAEDMRVVLGEAAHAHDAMQCARGLVAGTGPELGQTQRQVTIGLDAVVEDLHVAGAVHRLERVDDLFLRAFLVDLDDEHVLAVVRPVPRGLPELAVHHLRRVHLDIAVLALAAAHVVLQRGVDRPAVRVPEHLTGRLFLHVEEVHLLAELAVVALGGFLEHDHVRLQVIAGAEGDAIDALQHRPRAVAQPVGAGDMGQLEGVGGHLAGRLQVRAAAQVLPVAVPVHADVLALGDAVHQLDLVGLAGLHIVLDRRLARPDLGAHRLAGVDDLLHLRLDRAEVFGGEGLGPVEVVEPAVIAHRPDRDLHIRPDLLHGAGHDMGEVVADQFQRRNLILHRVDRDPRIGVDRPLQVVMRAVHLRRDRRLGERFRDRGGNLARGHAGGKFALAAIGKGEGDFRLGHGWSSSSVWRPRSARLRVMIARVCARSRGKSTCRGAAPGAAQRRKLSGRVKL
ncbi:hypothetical protein SDC9_39452 [bioreactor metagenome]|uniref:NAD-specific glutamate dehydrogenase n=1 Tax=bioreactor metagenome TaxID=1076179 RepID=A0A644VPQ3_9ZZZZ